MQAMTPRERVLTALRHEEPDRVPLDLGSTTTTIETDPYNDLKAYLGLTEPTRAFVRDHVAPHDAVLQRFGIDTRYVRIKPPQNFRVQIEPDNSYVDEWGTRWKKPPSSLYWDPVEHPLKDATRADLETYPWPDPDDPGRYAGLRADARRLREETDYAIVADNPVLGLFESGWVFLCGPERFFTDMILDPPFIQALMAKLTHLHMRFYENYLNEVGAFIDVIMASDDLGTERGPLISPAHYRQLIRPYQQQLWQSIKQRTDAYLFLHSCGSIYEFLPDLIEMGVDIISPVQVAAKDMDTQRLKAEFGAELTFWGAIDTQYVLPFGSPHDVEAEAKKRIADLAPGGGFVLTAVHNIQAGVRPANICKMYDTAMAYGKYPIVSNAHQA
ncbi:MAG: hypothetical protein JSW39_02375 [Desulfobacterales bacterium]|nr:MAG: hypothetical protein JSW39_02375 [Desulfobacterales bacterium]